MKRFLLSLMGLSIALFMGCSSDDSAPTVPQQGGGEQVPGGDPTPGGSGSSQAPDVSNDTYYATFPTANTVSVDAMYQQWISKFYVTSEEELKVPGDLGTEMTEKLSGSARIKFDIPLNTVSEGMGYGMLITYFMKDWEKFNRLLKYYKAYAVSAVDGLYFMKWKVLGDANNGGFTWGGTGGSATDADLDVALALLLAYAETGNADYLDYGTKIAGSIYNTEVNADTHLLMPGNDGLHMNDGYVYNISYFSLVALRMFAKYDTERAAQWNQVLESTIAYMSKVQNNGNGLWPDWSDAAGVPKDPENGSTTGKNCNYYGQEGVRIPLRIIWDYDWFGDERTKAMAEKAANYAWQMTNGDINNTVSKYIYQGDQPTSLGLGGWHFRAAFCALWTVGGTVANGLAACNDAVLGSSMPSGNNYFEPSMKMLYTLYINGYFKKVWNH